MPPQLRYGKNCRSFDWNTYNGLTPTRATGTLTLAASKVFTVNNTITLQAPQDKMHTFPTMLDVGQDRWNRAHLYRCADDSSWAITGPS